MYNGNEFTSAIKVLSSMDKQQRCLVNEGTNPNLKSIRKEGINLSGVWHSEFRMKLYQFSVTYLRAIFSFTGSSFSSSDCCWLACDFCTSSCWYLKSFISDTSSFLASHSSRYFMYSAATSSWSCEDHTTKTKTLTADGATDDKQFWLNEANYLLEVSTEEAILKEEIPDTYHLTG